MRRRILFRSVFGILLGLVAPPIFGQTNSVNTFAVPFVGCKSDGQVGPVEAPEGTPMTVPVSQTQAQQLAYYKSDTLAIGVLAPRGWHCFGLYGSGGSSLFVVPQQVDTENILSQPIDFGGPAIQIHHRLRPYDVAQVAGRIFPAYKENAERILEDIDQKLPPGPYPADILSYKSASHVEYTTPAAREGLGTLLLAKSSGPIEGAVIITPDFNLLHIAMRLPNNFKILVPVIIAQFEREVSRRHPH